ncbi:preprotein translocase subunit YajC [Lactobacillus sp. ESL0677]|uniref:preprotein translocase subunit YajC n=1 Tax=Lactobacillus sp. ESL0677 TaxID=2983208 RepID=UPI0023F91E86|nr:preprotein translocase subunit YajC [Lactobacillus sp. ESL0677]WEV37312.1 preprotein translocase subunit YajC [Lactobacillus sp. ESL0677]
MNWVNILLIILVVVLLILYLVILPIARRKSMTRNQQAMSDFFKSLHENEKVVLLNGVVGTIKSVSQHYVNLEIAQNVIVKVDKHGIASELNQGEKADE